MAHPPVKKVVLAYSGGLDSSTIVKWLQTELGAEVATFTADLGQGEEVEPAREKAILLGAETEAAEVQDHGALAPQRPHVLASDGRGPRSRLVGGSADGGHDAIGQPIAQIDERDMGPRLRREVRQQAADLHGGTITLEPADGGGTVARLTLPLA